MGQTTGSTLNQRVFVRQLEFDEEEDAFVWNTEYSCWAGAEADTRSNRFSSVGVGATGVTFTLRKNKRLTLYKSLIWRGQFCFLTSILDAEPGFVTAKAALCETVTCRADADRDPPGYRFPGILTEKYVGHAQPDLHGEVTTDYVLVTPKDVALAPGSWVTAAGRFYRVLVPHELDPYKNEYEIRRREDC